MSYTLTTAAKACGVSRTTIFRAIKSGKLSADKDANKNYIIEPAELHRIFLSVTDKETEKQNIERHAQESETGVTAMLRQENAFLKQQIEREREALEREREVFKELSRRLDQADQERREAQTKLTALLTYQPEPKAETVPEPTAEPKTTPNKGGLWQKLFGK